MLYNNLDRLIDASPFADRLSDVAKEALIEFLIDTDQTDLNTLNIDDIIVNGISIVSKGEYEEYYYPLLAEDGDDYYVWS